MTSRLTTPGKRFRERLRRLFGAQFPPYGQPDLKALLAAAPLEGVDLRRDGDTGRDADGLGARILNRSKP